MKPTPNPAILLLERARDTFAPSLRVPSNPQLTIASAWETLRRQLGIEAEEVAEKIARMCGLESAEGHLEVRDPSLIEQLPRRVAFRGTLLPLRREGPQTVVAIANPLDHARIQDLEFAFDSRLTLVVADPLSIEVAIEGAYGAGGGSHPLLLRRERDPGTERGSFAHIPHLGRELMIRAVDEGASDVHIQPFVHGSVVRIRVDGLLRRIALLPSSVAESVIRFVKAQADMDPTSSLAPQDGRLAVADGDRSFDLRISTLPVAGGQEKLVVRILGRRRQYRLTELGLSVDEIHSLRRLAAAPSGVVLFCGPTGSGKTTTLYTILSELNTEAVSIATVENPVEYMLPGVAQTEVNERAGTTFPSALRALLRQDPDVILVGEIRDGETASIAFQAALTGHLVFSTLHTRNSIAALPRLLDLGLDPVVVSESIAGIVSQRLLRRLCPECSIPVDTAGSVRERLFESVTRTRPARRAGSCEACRFTGYRGRISITAGVEMTPALADTIVAGKVGYGTLREAVGPGFRPLSVTAARHVISGDTTVEEAERVLGRAFWMEVAASHGTGTPDLSGVGSIGTDEGSTRSSVLLLPFGDDEFDPLRKRFENAWFSTWTAREPETARALLEEHEDIAFGVADLGAGRPDDEVVADIARFREAVAWSRLPALLLIEEGRDDLRARLVSQGATSRFMNRNAPVEEIVRVISEGLSDHVDFLWGVDSRTGETSDG